MKFKLVENYDYYVDEARLLVQEYAYDAIDELKDASFDTYFKWFFDNIGYEEDPAILKQAVKDFYIEAVDSGKIKRPKTMITSQLKDYIESNSNLLDNVDALINNCPEHLRHELQLALDVAELNESLNENKGETDKRLMVDVVNLDGSVKINGCDYVLHHINGEKEKARNRVTSNYLLIPVEHNGVSGHAIHIALHRLARHYKDLEDETKSLDAVPWLYVGAGHKLQAISAKELVDTLKNNLPNK